MGFDVHRAMGPFNVVTAPGEFNCTHLSSGTVTESCPKVIDKMLGMTPGFCVGVRNIKMGEY